MTRTSFSIDLFRRRDEWERVESETLGTQRAIAERDLLSPDHDVSCEEFFGTALEESRLGDEVLNNYAIELQAEQTVRNIVAFDLSAG